MGGSKPSPPSVKYIPAPPPPTPVSVPTQSLESQLALSRVAYEQQKGLAERGAELDRVNEEFFAGQDIRRLQAQGAEQRLTTKTTGEEERKGMETTGAQQRLTEQTRGAEQRLTEQTRGAEQRKGIETTGQQERLTVGKTAEETRATALQQEQFRRYKEERDYQQSQQAYKS